MYVEEAIQLALESRWTEALATNQALVDKHGADDDACNRMGKALTELGRLDEALAEYSSALRLNPLNLIAQKNVRKLSALLEKKETVPGAAQTIDVDVFTEEPGKSALTVLTSPREEVAVTVAPGDVVLLIPDGPQLRAETARGVALGDVESKLARRLVPLITSGNRYAAAVARVEDRDIEIIIREVYQAAENARTSSFPISRGSRREEFRPYTKDALLSSREIDPTPLMVEDDDDRLAETAVESDDELEGMAVTTLEEDGSPEAASSDGDDDESRPEDEY